MVAETMVNFLHIGKKDALNIYMTSLLKATSISQLKIFCFSPIRCSFCKELFTDGRTLRLHVVSVHEDLKEYKCETCGKVFSTTKILERHIQASVCHRNGFKYRCNNCNKSISTSYSLEQHVNLGMFHISVIFSPVLT